MDCCIQIKFFLLVEISGIFFLLAENIQALDTTEHFQHGISNFESYFSFSPQVHSSGLISVLGAGIANKASLGTYVASDFTKDTASRVSGLGWNLFFTLFETEKFTLDFIPTHDMNFWDDDLYFPTHSVGLNTEITYQIHPLFMVYTRLGYQLADFTKAIVPVTSTTHLLGGYVQLGDRLQILTEWNSSLSYLDYSFDHDIGFGANVVIADWMELKADWIYGFISKEYCICLGFIITWTTK